MSGETVDVDAWVAARAPGLLRLAFALTGDGGSAEAVVVEALSRALPRWRRVTRDGDAEHAVRRLVVAAHLARARRLGRGPSGRRPAGSRFATVEHPGGSDARVRAAFRALPAGQQTVMVLRCVEELGWAEVADLARTRESAARQQVERGLATVRRDLGLPSGADTGLDPLVVRLREALPAAHDEVPSDRGLPRAARVRRGERRRRRVGVVAVGLASLGLSGVVAAALAVSDGAPDKDGEPDRPQGDTPSEGDELPPADPRPPGEGPTAEPGADGRPAGYRWETWHRLQVAVPDSWDYDDSGLCLPPGPMESPPVVQRPGGEAPGLGCGVAAGEYGVQFADANDLGDRSTPGQAEGRVAPGDDSRFPVDSWVGFERSGLDAVRVVARSRAELRSILSSLRRVSFRDVHGCPVAAVSTFPPIGEGVSVCRYDSTGLLVQAERLTGSSAVDAKSSVEDAPRLDQPACGASSVSGLYDGRVLLRYSGTRVTVDLTGPACRRGIRVDDGERRQLTPRLLYWALSPGWSGPAADGVALPERLRSREDGPPAT